MINIRLATSSDIEPLIYLNYEVQSLHIDIAPSVFCEVKEDELSKWFEEQVEDDNTQLYIAENSRKILGYLILKVINRPSNPFMLEQHFAYIDHMSVDSEYRGKGIGRKLISSAVDFAKDCEIGHIELDVWSKNINAKNAYKQIGFQPSREKLVCKVEL